MYEIKFNVPEKIKDKKIPKNNTNPLQYLSNIYGLYGIHFFGQITAQILYDLFDYNHNVYRSVIHQLAFYGFIFDGVLSEYNKINNYNKRYYLTSTNKYKIKYEIKYNQFLDEYLISLMKRNGLVYNFELNDLFLEVLIKETNNMDNLFNFLLNNDIKVYDEKSGEIITNLRDLKKTKKNKLDNEINEESKLISNNLKTRNQKQIDNNFSFVLKDILSHDNNNRNVDIFLKRVLENKTLQSIGDQHDISRERVRQIYRKLKMKIHNANNYKRLKPFINIIEKPFDSKKIIPINSFKIVQNEFFNELNIKQIIKIYELLTSNKIYLIKNKLLSLKNREYIKKRYTNLFNGSFGVIELFKFKNVLSDLISREYIDSLIEVSPDLFLYDEKVYLANTKTEMVNLIIKEFYPNGINISEELDEFKNILNVVFPGYFNEDTNRALRANFERNNSNLILCDKGVYIDFDNIDIEKKDLIKIKEYIQKQLKLKTEIRIHRPYNKFKRYLNTLNIQNQYSLYFTLKEFFGDELYFYKYPRILPDSMKGKEIPDNSDLIDDFFKVNDGEVDQQRLERYFINKYCWTKEQLNNNLNYNNKIIQIDNINYIHTDYKINIKTNLEERIIEKIKNESNIFYTLNKIELLKLNTSKSLRQVFRLIKNSSKLILLGLKKDEKIIILSNNKSNISNESDFIAYIIDFVFNGIVQSYLLEDYLSEIGFIEKKLPRSYKNNNNDLPYVYFDQTFVSK